jgi:hypothetical protein
VAAYVEGGFLDPDSSPVLLQFGSPDVQAILAGLFLAREPDRLAAVVAVLGATGPARRALASALCYDSVNSPMRVHASLLAALAGGTPLSAAAQAAGLSLAISYPPPSVGAGELDGLAGRLALVLADRVTTAGAAAVGVAGLRDAARALSAVDCAGSERHLLAALHSSSFQVRLAVALAHVRRARSSGYVRSAASGQDRLTTNPWECPWRSV